MVVKENPDRKKNKHDLFTSFVIIMLSVHVIFFSKATTVSVMHLVHQFHRDDILTRFHYKNFSSACEKSQDFMKIVPYFLKRYFMRNIFYLLSFYS